MDGFYPIDKFIISKTLKSKYKKPQTIAHKVLADRMGVRDPGNKPQVNDRIPFVYVVTKVSKQKKKDILQGDLIEHPDFVIKNKLKIDYLYYLEHQIINPATQILELMVPTKYVNKLFSEFIVGEWNKRLGRQNFDKWITYNSNSESETDDKAEETSNEQVAASIDDEQVATPPDDKEERASFPIVGMGASAGGLEAFEQFFGNMRPDSEMAFILVPHLDPTH